MQHRAKVQRDDVTAFVRTYSRKHGEAPTTRTIRRGLGMKSAAALYKLFSSIDDIYTTSGVSTVPERKAKVERATEARRALVQHRKDEGRDPKKEFEERCNEYNKELERSKYGAMLDPSKIPAYASMTLPTRDPGLWRKLQLLGGEVSASISATFFGEPDYLEDSKKHMIKREKLPDFDDYLVGRLSDFIRRRVENRGYSDSPPMEIDDKCSVCRSSLRFSAKTSAKPIFCSTCNKHKQFPCPVCESQMGGLPPDMLRCHRCGYRLKFEHQLFRDFDTYEDYLNEFAAGRIPSDYDTQYGFIWKLPGGKVQFIPFFHTRDPKGKWVRSTQGRPFLVNPHSVREVKDF